MSPKGGSGGGLKRLCAKTASAKSSSGKPAKRCNKQGRDATKASSGSSAPARSGQVLKCLKCNGLSSQRKWFRSTPGKGSDELPLGTACFECGSVHREGFSHMSWEDFCEAAQKDLKGAVDEAVVLRSGNGTPSFLPANVETTRDVSIEIRTPVQIVTAAQLRAAFGRSKLPAHMKSVPTLNLPLRGDEAASGSSGSGATERVFCFSDPKEPYRTAVIVERIGVSSRTPQLRQQLWGGQADALVESLAAKQASSSHSGSIQEAKKLQTLEQFVEERGGKLNKKKGGQARSSKAKGSKGDGSDGDGGVSASQGASDDDGKEGSAEDDEGECSDEGGEDDDDGDDDQDSDDAQSMSFGKLGAASVKATPNKPKTARPPSPGTERSTKSKGRGSCASPSGTRSVTETCADGDENLEGTIVGLWSASGSWMLQRGRGDITRLVLMIHLIPRSSTPVPKGYCFEKGGP